MDTLEEDILYARTEAVPPASANAERELLQRWASLMRVCAQWAQATGRGCLRRAELVRLTAPGAKPELEHEWKREWRDWRLIP